MPSSLIVHRSLSERGAVVSFSGSERRHHYEYTDAAGAKQLAVTLVVHNTGKSAVLSSTVTVQVKTDQREYLQTAGFANKIIPDGKVSLTVSVPYLNPAEQLAPDGVSIYDSFFD